MRDWKEAGKDQPPGGMYFGEPWPSGICDDGEQVTTPTGLLCGFCNQAVVDGENGSFMGNGLGQDFGFPVEDYPVIPVHKECSLRSVIGCIYAVLGIHHQHGVECPEFVSRREDALVVWKVFKHKTTEYNEVKGGFGI